MKCLLCMIVLVIAPIALGADTGAKLTTEVPGNLFFKTEKPAGLISTDRPDWQDRELAVALVYYDANDSEVARAEHTITLHQGTASIELPSEPGYYRVEGELSQKAAEGSPSEKFTAYYAVVPTVTNLDQKDLASPFGVNTHLAFDDHPYPPQVGAVARRAGIAWVRDGGDNLARVAEAVGPNHLCWLWTLSGRYRDTGYFMDKLTAGKESRQWDFSPELNEQRSEVRQYAAYADAYDLINEPAGPWAQALGGSWNGGEWMHALAAYGKQLTEMIREEDPGSPMLWETQGPVICYDEYLDLQLKPWIDAVSPHVYRDHEGWGSPEHHPILPQYDEFRSMLAKQQLDWQLWVGEFGFTTWTPPPGHEESWGAVTEAQQADLLVRATVLHWMAGADKLFYYDLVEDGPDPATGQHHYGIIRMTTHEPKPGIVAYANVIDQLRTARRMGACRLGVDVYAYAVLREGKPVVIAWIEGDKPRTVSLPADNTDVAVMDVYGRTSQVNGDVTLTSSPVYITGLSYESVASILKTPVWANFEHE